MFIFACRPVISWDFFYKSPFASTFSWKKTSGHQGKKEVACIVSNPLVSCLWGFEACLHILLVVRSWLTVILFTLCEACLHVAHRKVATQGHSLHTGEACLYFIDRKVTADSVNLYRRVGDTISTVSSHTTMASHICSNVHLSSDRSACWSVNGPCWVRFNSARWAHVPRSMRKVIVFAG